MGQKEPPSLGSTICYGQARARKSHQDSAVPFLTAKCGPEQPSRLGSTICCGQELARKSHRDSAARFVAARRGPEKGTKTRQYDLWPNVGQKEPSRLGCTICYGQTWAKKSHRDSAVRFVTAKSWPERVTETRQYDLLRLNVGQKEPLRLGSTTCYGQMWARKSHQDSAVRFVTAKSWPERATKTRCNGQMWARKSHRVSAVRFFTAKSWPERASETRQYDLLRPHVGQNEPPRFGSTICYDQTWARKSHRDTAVRFVTAKSWPERATEIRQFDVFRPNVAVQFVTAKGGPEAGTKTRQYDLLRPNVGQKEPPRFGSTICYDQTWARKSHRDTAVRFVTAKRGPERVTETRQFDVLRPNVGRKEPPRLGSTIYGQTWARKSHQDSAVRFVTTKRGPEGATETRQYDLLRPNVGQKDPPRLGSTICSGQTWARKSHRDSAVRFLTAKSWPEIGTETRQYDLLRPNVGQKELPRLGSSMCFGQTWARKSHRDTPVRCVTARRGPETVTKTRQYDLLRPSKGQKEPPRLGSTISYRKMWARTAIKTRQYDLLRPRVGQKEPPRLGSTICGGQTWARKSHQDSAVRFVIAKKSWPERATETRQYDLLRANVGQEEPPRLGSTICYGQPWARKSHRDSAVRFVMTKRGPERTTETRQYELLRPRFGQKKPPRLGNSICCGQTWARKSHQDSAVRFVATKRGPERAFETWQYDLLQPDVGQRKPPRLGSTIYG